MTGNFKGPPQPPFVLAIDIGSTSVRARLYDARARAIPNAGCELRRTPSADGVEDPASLVETTETAIDGALAAAGDLAGDIAGVAMATFVGNVMGVDSRGDPVTPLYTYAHSGAAAEVEELRSALDADAAYQRTGCPFHTSYQAPRLLWLRHRRPDLFALAGRWVDLGTYLYSRWFGTSDVSASYSVASWSGMLDRVTLTWDRPILGYLELDASALPALADYDQPMCRLAGEWARRWPALAEAPFFLAVGDGAGANVGSGCGVCGSLALTVGTTGAMRAVIDGAPPTVPQGLWAYRVDRDHSLMGGAITDGGSLLAWLHKTLRFGGDHLPDEEIARVEPDGHGLTVLPFLRGERSPGWATDASATWHGIRAATTPAEMARAALEAVTYRFYLISQLLDRMSGPYDEVIVGGAAILSLPTWMQMLADVLGKTVVAAPNRGTTARGITVLALKALGAIDSLDALPAQLGDRYEPCPSRSARYQQGLTRHLRLYDMLVRNAP